MTETEADGRDVNHADDAETTGDDSDPIRRDPVAGTADDGDDLGFEIWGGVVAWLGFIFTPLVTAVPASYLALKVRESNPGAYYGILAVVAATCLFWVLVVFAPEILAAILAALTGGSLTVLVLVVPVVVLFVAIAGLVYILRE